MACANNNKQELKQQRPKDQSNTPQLNRAGFPRQKASKACTKCRERKVRCQPSPTGDGPCVSCAKNKKDCQWPEARAPKVPPKVILESIENRLNYMNRFIDSLQHNIKMDEESDDEEYLINLFFRNDNSYSDDNTNVTLDPVGTALFYGNGTELLEGLGDNMDDVDAKHLDLVATYLPDYGNISERNNSSYVTPLLSNDLQSNHHFENTFSVPFGSNNQNISTTMNSLSLPPASAYSEYLLADDSRSIMPEAPLPSSAEIRGPQELPSQDVIERLVMLYIKHVHWYFPIFHRSSLLNRIRNPSCMSLCLLNALFANAAWYDPSLRARSGEFYTRAVTLLEDYQDQARLSTIQATLLIFKYQEHMDREGFSWRTHANFGFIAQSIKELGLDKKKEGTWEGDLWEEEERRRVYWTCLMVDRIYCGSQGRPFNIKEGDSELPDTLLTEDDPVEVKWVKYTESLTKISIIIGRIIEFNRWMARCNHKATKGKPKNSQKSTDAIAYNAFRQLVFSLSIWLSKLPSFFVYPPTNKEKYPAERQSTGPQIGLLHVLYHLAVILVHKPDITESDYSILSCSASASHITNICETLYQEDPDNFHKPIYGVNFFIYCLTQAQNIHKYNMEFSSDPKFSVPALSEFRRTSELLQRIYSDEDMMEYSRKRSVSLAPSSSSSTTARSISSPPPSSSSSFSSPSISATSFSPPSSDFLLTPNQDDTSPCFFMADVASSISTPFKPFKMYTGPSERPTRKRRLNSDNQPDDPPLYPNDGFAAFSSAALPFSLSTPPPHRSYHPNQVLAPVCRTQTFHHNIEQDSILQSNLYPGYIGTGGEALYQNQQPVDFVCMNAY